MSDNSVGAKIAALRRSLNESQAVFGERFGVEQVTVSRWEKGEPVARKHQEPLARLANMTVAQFFHGPDQPRLIPVIAEVSSETFHTEEPPPGAPVEHFTLRADEGDQASFRIKGDVFEPYYHDGDLLVGPRLRGNMILDALGKECMIMTTTGLGHLRILREGSSPGRYSLRSTNPRAADIEDVDLAWVAPIKLIVRD